jgi:hypothetical protein
MTRPVNDDATPRDDDAFRCAPDPDSQSAAETSSDVEADNQEGTPEEAGYGYGV